MSHLKKYSKQLTKNWGGPRANPDVKNDQQVPSQLLYHELV